VAVCATQDNLIKVPEELVGLIVIPASFVSMSKTKEIINTTTHKTTLTKSNVLICE
jgi:hypothetical protein